MERIWKLGGGGGGKTFHLGGVFVFVFTSVSLAKYRAYLGNNRKYFVNFCLKFANGFVPKV